MVPLEVRTRGRRDLFIISPVSNDMVFSPGTKGIWIYECLPCTLSIVSSSAISFPCLSFPPLFSKVIMLVSRSACVLLVPSDLLTVPLVVAGSPCCGVAAADVEMPGAFRFLDCEAVIAPDSDCKAKLDMPGKLSFIVWEGAGLVADGRVTADERLVLTPEDFSRSGGVSCAGLVLEVAFGFLDEVHSTSPSRSRSSA